MSWDQDDMNGWFDIQDDLFEKERKKVEETYDTECVCDIISMMRVGCKCGAIEEERRKQKDEEDEKSKLRNL